MDSHRDHRPGETVKLQLRTDSPALVALGAVDTALYAVGGRSHKPLDMGKVCEIFSPASLVLVCGSFSCCPEPGAQPLALTQAARDSFQPSLKLWSYFPTVSCLSTPPSHHSQACPSATLVSATALPYLARSLKS